MRQRLVTYGGPCHDQPLMVVMAGLRLLRGWRAVALPFAAVATAAAARLRSAADAFAKVSGFHGRTERARQPWQHDLL